MLDLTAFTRPMVRYFFHFHDGTDHPDDTGTEFASVKGARDAAVVFMGEKLKELDGDFWPEANGPSASWIRPAQRSTQFALLGIRVPLPHGLGHRRS